MSLSQMGDFSLNVKKEINKKYNLKGKYRVLSMIREHKTILFGPICNKQNKDIRIEKWKQIFAFAASLNVVPVRKDYMYVRDVFWQNCRKYAISKLENCKIGKNLCSLTACDRVSLEIIGRGSEADAFEIESDIDIKHDLFDFPAESEANCSVTSTNVMRSSRISKLKRGATPKTKKEPSLLVKKQELVIEHLQLLNYKAKLEIALMEKQLELQPSVFTKCIQGGYEGSEPSTFDSSFGENWHCEDERGESENITEAVERDDEDEEEDTKPLINLF